MSDEQIITAEEAERLTQLADEQRQEIAALKSDNRRMVDTLNQIEGLAKVAAEGKATT
jgi:small-conductance mechanosensitive channel